MGSGPDKRKRHFHKFVCGGAPPRNLLKSLTGNAAGKIKVSKDVIPGRCKASNYDVQLHIGESRDSGSGAAHHPGMTPNTMGCISSQTLEDAHGIDNVAVDGALAVRQGEAGF